jgi:site-specific DNA-methyltransferase (adenine-specific)
MSLDELAVRANDEHRLGNEAARDAANHWVAAGRALLEAKAQVGHGEWLPWLTTNFEGSERTARRYMTVAANRTRVADLDAEGLSLRALLKRVERIDREEQAEQRRLEPVAKLAVGEIEVRPGDFRTCLSDLAGQVDAVITDPPYPAQFIEEFDALGAAAAELLKPDGVLVAMVGQTYLPEYIERLSRHLTYRWCGAYLTEGPATRIHGRNVGSKWKPLLIFDKAGERRFLIQDTFASDGGDKQHHHWGQSESGIAVQVERLTVPGDLVVDPFLGGGTTAFVCRELGRRFVGCDIDPAFVHVAQERLAG